ncbi:MAG: hypothetical protein P4L36_19410 [Holophaga sp.]|nr:hypothetical protein [Holophaga sp.]
MNDPRRSKFLLPLFFIAAVGLYASGGNSEPVDPPVGPAQVEVMPHWTDLIYPGQVSFMHTHGNVNLVSITFGGAVVAFAPALQEGASVWTWTVPADAPQGPVQVVKTFNDGSTISRNCQVVDAATVNQAFMAALAL